MPAAQGRLWWRWGSAWGFESPVARLMPSRFTSAQSNSHTALPKCWSASRGEGGVGALRPPSGMPSFGRDAAAHQLPPIGVWSWLVGPSP